MKSWSNFTQPADITMFKLTCFVDISEGRSGMLIPLLSAQNTNLPYVQQMDEFFQVKEIVPFLAYENYPISPSDQSEQITIGDNGLIAFRSFDQTIICGKITEILDYITRNKLEISHDPTLHLQLQRIEAAELQPSYEAWRRISKITFTNESQAHFWVDSEHNLFQKQKKIWAEIDPLDVDEPTFAEAGFFGSISEKSTEYLFRWLSNRSNYISKDWTKVWHYVHARTPFDDRIHELALNWIFVTCDDDTDLGKTRSILYMLLERWKVGFHLQDLGEYLGGRLASDPTLLFRFLRPRSLFIDLLNYLSKCAPPDDALAIIRFSVFEVPKDEKLISGIESALANLYENNESEQTQRAGAHVLWQELSRLSHIFSTDV